MRRALILLTVLSLWVASGCDLNVQPVEEENEGGGGASVSSAGPEPPYEAVRPFSASTDCKFCHPRQYQEWRSSPHSYSGISPTFYSLVAAGQNSFGAGVLVNGGDNPGTAQAGGVAAFCLPCHSPMAFMGLEGRYSGNNAGKTDVQPMYPFVCNLASGDQALEPCTAQTSIEDCGAPGRCATFSGRTCINTPPAQPEADFPRILVHCMDDSDCAAGTNACPSGGDDCGPCIVAPATIYYDAIAQEGINCEVCHNAIPNHQRACQLFRNSDSAAVFSLDVEEREADNGQRLRLGPYPVEGGAPGSAPAPNEGLPNDALLPVLNAFHESARVDTPLVVPYDQTDRAGGTEGFTDPSRLKPTALTCEELPYCRAGLCEGGPNIGITCADDYDCGGCGGRQCGPLSYRALEECETSHDCAEPGSLTEGILVRAVDDGTLGPLSRRDVGGSFEIDRTDANWFRSSYMCAACHDVRPPFGNPILKSCQFQDTHVCNTDADCDNIGLVCPQGVGGSCGPCVMENSSSPEIPGSASHGMPAPGHPRNTGARRVENLFTEWQISLYNHPELIYCAGDSFRVCTADTDCGPVDGSACVDGDCSDFDGPCDLASPYNEVVTCQDCHMSLFPKIPLIYDANLDGTPDTITPKNWLYAADKAAIEGSQSNILEPLPIRRVSTHFMPGVDLPLVNFSGQGTQEQLRQELLDAAYKLDLDLTPATASPGMSFDVELRVENVGVGHRLPAGFSHERQNWIQLYVQTAASVAAAGDDPFALTAPCNMQGVIATGADQADDVDYIDQTGAMALEAAGCVYRSGFILDKGHPETGETSADGNLDDEDPEDFLVVAGTRVRGLPTDPRIEVQPGAAGRSLDIQFICEEVAEEVYLSGIRDGRGVGMGVDLTAPHQLRFCDPNLSPQIPGEGMGRNMGFTAPGFGNPDCMESTEDLGPCVPEIELSDANERGRCAKDLSRTSCQGNADCGDAGPCLYLCSEFIELQCCDEDAAGPEGDECRAFYSEIGASECELGFEGSDDLICIRGPNNGMACTTDVDCGGAAGTCEMASDASICIGGEFSGQGCTKANEATDCPGHSCGGVGECVDENRGIVNFQNQFRQTFNGVCVDRTNPRDARNIPIPLMLDGKPAECLLNLSCTLQGVKDVNGDDGVCLMNGQCADDEDTNTTTGNGTLPLSGHGDACTNVTYRDDCGLTAAGDTISCNVERSVELNGRPSESVFIQNHPFNFNSLPPLQPKTFEYHFDIPASFAGQDLVVSARVMNRHFPMRFLRNLIGTQVIRPPFIMEGQGDASNPDECNDPRTIDIDCFVKPVVLLGRAEVGGFVPPNQTVLMKTVTVDP